MMIIDPPTLSVKNDWRYVVYVETEKGTLGLTKTELNFLKAKVSGKIVGRKSHYNCRTLYNKIRKFTDWNMQPSALICRFAYRYKILEP